MARKSKVSQKELSRAVPCKLPGCKRTVKRDNPTFPYCHDHVHLKTMKSSIVDLGKYTMDEVRNLIYNPTLGRLSPTALSMDILRDSLMMSEKDIVRTYSTWAKAVKSNNVNPRNPLEAFTGRDQVLSDIQEDLSSDYDVSRLHCSKGTLFVPQHGVVKTDDHVVLHIEGSSGDFVLDGVSSAPLKTFYEEVSQSGKDIHDVIPYGTSTCMDGCNMSSVYEYCAFSSVRYNTVKDESGDVVWNNVKHNSSEQKDIQSQRDIIRESGFVPREQTIYIPNSFIEKKKQAEENIQPEDIDGILQREESQGKDYMSLEDLLSE